MTSGLWLTVSHAETNKCFGLEGEKRTAETLSNGREDSSISSTNMRLSYASYTLEKLSVSVPAIVRLFRRSEACRCDERAVGK